MTIKEIKEAVLLSPLYEGEKDIEEIIKRLMEYNINIEIKEEVGEIYEV